MIGVALALAAAAIHPSDPSPYFLDASTVVQVTCPDPKHKHGELTGTAFYIGGGKFITARHVIRDEEAKGSPLLRCTINKKPVRILDVGKRWVDYALISAPVYPDYRAIVSCDGFAEGRHYFATGFAEGNPWPVTQRLVGSGARWSERTFGHHEDNLRGTTTAGQSGGPVSDDDGVVVGLVSAGAEDGETIALFLSLADTPICKK